MCSMVLPQPSAVFYPHGTVCNPPDHSKQCDEHLSHEHLSLLPSFPPGENRVGIVLINYTVRARCLYQRRQG